VRCIFAAVIIGFAATSLCCAGPNEAAAEAADAADAAADVRPTEAPAAAAATQPSFDHIKIDREASVIDVEAEVTLREGDWLELLICSPDTKEHESILVTEARPSELHVALLLIGIEAGKPLTWKKVGEDELGRGEFEAVPPTGGRVRVSLVTKGEDGEEREVPAGDWVADQKTVAMHYSGWRRVRLIGAYGPYGKPGGPSEYLFTGSRIVEWDGDRYYAANAAGTVVSLVHFGDDVIAPPDSIAAEGGGNTFYSPYTPRIPAEGEKVIVRFRPAPAE